MYSAKGMAMNMQKQDELRLAVLIDADNAPRRQLKEIMEEIAVYGTPTVKRIYGDWTSPNLTGWKKPLLETAITPIQQYGYTTGKNATDSAMIIDAMDILYSGRVDGFCIVSSDSDFTRLATRLREAGMKVFGFGEKKTPNPFIVACDKFLYIEIIGGEKKKAKAKAKEALPPAEPESQPKPAKTPKAAAKAPPANQIPEEIVDLISTAIDDVADDDGWAYLGGVGNLISKKQPDFDARNYGYKKLTLLIDAIESIEMDFRDNVLENNGKLIFIRNKK
jgi:uncharacterized LabA/DUF88 family protein